MAAAPSIGDMEADSALFLKIRSRPNFLGGLNCG